MDDEGVRVSFWIKSCWPEDVDRMWASGMVPGEAFLDAPLPLKSSLVSMDRRSEKEHSRDFSFRTPCGCGLTGFPGRSSLKIIDSFRDQVQFARESRDS